MNIKPERLMPQVVFVQPDLVSDGYLVPPVDLRPSGKPWQDLMDTALSAQCNEVILIEKRRPGAHKTHVPNQNTPKLRELIKAGFTQKRTDGR